MGSHYDVLSTETLSTGAEEAGLTAPSVLTCRVVGIGHVFWPRRWVHCQCQSHWWHQSFCLSVLKHLNSGLRCASREPCSGTEGVGIWLLANHWMNPHSWPQSQLLFLHCQSCSPPLTTKCLKNINKYTMTGLDLKRWDVCMILWTVISLGLTSRCYCSKCNCGACKNIRQFSRRSIICKIILTKIKQIKLKP